MNDRAECEHAETGTSFTPKHPDFLRRLFELEVPEIHGGTVEVNRGDACCALRLVPMLSR